MPLSWTPKKAGLHRTISAIRAETWEAIKRILLVSARQEQVETGKVVRLDSTVTAALMHQPSDSSLLWDAVRVMARLLKAADALIGGLVWRNHRRAAKKRARAIEYARNRPTRVQLYRELIKLTRAISLPCLFLMTASRMLTCACDTASRLCVRAVLCSSAFSLAPPLRAPTGSAAAKAALFARFRATTGRSDTLAYADQAATRSWQASDPIAATLWQAEFRRYHPLIERIVAQTERRVLHGEAIAANEKIVSLFEPHADIIVKGISCLKRAYGLARCIWRGLDHFRAYVWSSAGAYNLALFVRLKPG